MEVQNFSFPTLFDSYRELLLIRELLLKCTLRHIKMRDHFFVFFSAEKDPFSVVPVRK